MRIEAFGATHTGKVRQHNEDNIYVEGAFRNYLESENLPIPGKGEGDSGTYAVFDGLGGEEFGEKASYIAALGLKKFEAQRSASEVEEYATIVNRAICHETRQIGARSIGTTFVMLHIEGDRAYVSNIGDSRAYLLRDGSLRQLSKDHSLIQSMIDNGFADEAERLAGNKAGELTQYLGMSSEDDVEPSPSTVTMTVLPEDIFLLCSDGLSGELTDEEIESIMLENSFRSARHIAVVLVNETLKKAARDNVSAVVCKIV